MHHRSWWKEMPALRGERASLECMPICCFWREEDLFRIPKRKMQAWRGMPFSALVAEPIEFWSLHETQLPCDTLLRSYSWPTWWRTVSVQRICHLLIVLMKRCSTLLNHYAHIADVYTCHAENSYRHSKCVTRYMDNALLLDALLAAVQIWCCISLVHLLALLLYTTFASTLHIRAATFIYAVALAYTIYTIIQMHSTK